jgi:hypothetical protein
MAIPSRGRVFRWLELLAAKDDTAIVDARMYAPTVGETARRAHASRFSFRGGLTNGVHFPERNAPLALIAATTSLTAIAVCVGAAERESVASR